MERIFIYRRVTTSISKYGLTACTQVVLLWSLWWYAHYQGTSSPFQGHTLQTPRTMMQLFLTMPLSKMLTSYASWSRKKTSGCGSRVSGLTSSSLVFLDMLRRSVHIVSRTGVTHFKMLHSLTIPTLMTVCARNNCV